MRELSIKERTEEASSLRKQVIRFIVSIVILTVIQVIFEKLVYDEVGPKLEMKEALESFDPGELANIWMRAYGLREQSPSSEDKAKCDEHLRLCLSGSLDCKQDNLRIAPDPCYHLYQTDPLRVEPGYFELARSFWTVLSTVFGRDRSSNYRLFAFCQVLVGCGSTLAFIAYVLNRFGDRDIPLALVYAGAIIGTITMSVLLAYPMKWLALSTIPVVPAIYAGTALVFLNKAIDGALEKLVDRFVVGA
jgi:hypothetical protein